MTEPGAGAATSQALDDDLALLHHLLTDTLVRHEGRALDTLVQEVRRLAEEGDGGNEPLGRLLDGIDGATAAHLARAFAASFQLANIAEQVHRADELALRATIYRGGIGDTVDDVLAAGISPDRLAAAVEAMDVRPVLTAHPTEAKRRSVLTTRLRVAELLDVRHGAGDASDRRRIEDRLGEAVDLLWQTDELRRERPTPVDEAASVLYFLGTIGRRVLPDLLEDLSRTLGAVGTPLPARSRPVTFGTWVGGDRDGNPNVTPAVTLEVLGLHVQAAVDLLTEAVDDLIATLSTSSRLVAVSDELGASIRRDAELLPDVAGRYGRLNADEPYRLKCSFVCQRLRKHRRAGGHRRRAPAGAGLRVDR